MPDLVQPGPGEDAVQVFDLVLALGEDRAFQQGDEDHPRLIVARDHRDVCSSSQTIDAVAERRQSPSGHLRYSPAELSRRYHLWFKEYSDDPDAFRLAAIELENGDQVWLQRYEHDPKRGTVILLDAQADVVKSLALVPETFQLQMTDVDWAAHEPAFAVSD